MIAEPRRTAEPRTEAGRAWLGHSCDDGVEDQREHILAIEAQAALPVPALDARPRMMTPFERAAAIERDRQWGDTTPGGSEWSDQRKADALFMAAYDRRGLLNELGWRALSGSTKPHEEPR